MASSWGDSWGSYWGNSWGVITVTDDWILQSNSVTSWSEISDDPSLWNVHPNDSEVWVEHEPKYD